MPLVRFEVRNEYGLGDPELYRTDSKDEAPKAILDGIAFAGLVGILRQLGDLAGFAAAIFHDLHDEVMTTAARGRKMLSRVQRIESALPSLEKAVQGQRSYIHFAYTAGSGWHADVRTSQNQLQCSDLPQFMIDFYEECRGPPCLYLLDKFDGVGSGACLKRYSDPSYFQRALASSHPLKDEKVKRKKKKRGSRLRSGGIHHTLFTSRNIHSTQFASLSTDQLSFSVENASFFDTRSKSGCTKDSIHFDLETRSNCAEQVPDMPCVVPFDVSVSGEFSAPAAKRDQSDPTPIVLHNEPKQDTADDDPQTGSLQQRSAPSTSSVTWDEKTEIVTFMGANSYEAAAELVDMSLDLDCSPPIFETSSLSHEIAEVETVNEEDNVSEPAKEPVSCYGGKLFDEDPTMTDNFLPESGPGADMSEIPAETYNFEPVPGLGANLSDEILAERENVAPVSGPGENLSDENRAEMDHFALLSGPAANLFDAIPSETDNFTDATNTIETEMETDFECQTRRELESSNITRGYVYSRSCGLIETSRTVSNCFDPEAPIDAGSSSNNFVLSDCFDYAQQENGTCNASESGISTENGCPKCDIFRLPGSNASDYLDGELSPESSIANDQDVLVNNGTTYEISKSRDCLLKASSLPSATFWTNGGILGVAPSKPPDFIINASSETAAVGNGCKSRTVCLVVENDELDSDITVKKNSHDSIPGTPLVDLSENHEAPSGGTYAYTGGPDHGETDVIADGPDQSAICSNTSHFNGSDKKIQGISASFSGLAHKFLSNDLQRRILVAHAGLSTPSKLVNADFRKLQDILLQNDHKGPPKRSASNALCEMETEENTADESSRVPVSSSSPCFGSSSPPLGLMKNSFQPMNCSDSSKLKLQFSSGNLCEGNGDIVFPSFQLIPVSSTALQDSSSESEDDTFCKSSVFSTGDLLSPHSESSSDFWGEDERSESEKYRVSDDSCRNSLSEQMGRCSIASEKHVEVGNGGIDYIVDLPSVDSVTYAEDQQKEVCVPLAFGSMDSTSHSPYELPPPVPLPPLQRSVVKQSGKHHSLEDNNSPWMDFARHVDAQSQCFASDELQELGAPISACNADAVEHPSKKTDQEMLIGIAGPNHNCRGKEQNQTEDRLHQIRIQAVKGGADVDGSES